MSEVEYRDIPGFPGYRVGSDGTFWKGTKKVNLIKPKDQNVLKVMLKSNGKYKHLTAHTVLLEAFGQIRKDCEWIFYKNFDYSDVSIDNLKWISDERIPYNYCLQKFVPDISNIEYKDVPGYLGYIVGTNGDVWSCRTQSANKFGEWKKLKQKQNSSNKRMEVGIGSPTVTIQVHRLVLMTFIGERPNGLECCHNNGDYLNNNLSNLRYDSRESNTLDRHKHNNFKQIKQKLDDKTASEILWKLQNNGTVSQIARDYNLSYDLIQNIKHGRSWKHIKIGEKQCQD